MFAILVTEGDNVGLFGRVYSDDESEVAVGDCFGYIFEELACVADVEEPETLPERDILRLYDKHPGMRRYEVVNLNVLNIFKF